MYYVYRITNKINGKFYIGVHKTEDFEDDYMGSGVAIRSAIEKYGIENFDKTMLYCYDNKKEAYEMEKQLVMEKQYKQIVAHMIHVKDILGLVFQHLDLQKM